MAIADWIRDANEKRKRELVAEALERGRREGYLMGYDDGAEGKPSRPPTNGTNHNGNNDNGASE